MFAAIVASFNFVVYSTLLIFLMVFIEPALSDDLSEGSGKKLEYKDYEKLCENATDPMLCLLRELDKEEKEACVNYGELDEWFKSASC